MHVEYRDEFRCTPWQLWPFLDEVDKQRLWLTTLVDMAPTSKVPRSVGSTFDLHVREGRRIAHYEGRINAYDPPAIWACCSGAAPFPRAFRCKSTIASPT